MWKLAGREIPRGFSPSMQPMERPEQAVALERVVKWLGLELVDSATADLQTYAHWLGTEAVVAGGLGPNEAVRIWERHILDSLLYARALGDCDSVLDIGSGVGLPGIPLAIALPHVEFTLLDRSRRRCELARRAVRILDLPNVSVVEGTLAGYRGRHSCAVARAALKPDELLAELRAGGFLGTTVVTSGSRVAAPDVPDGWEIVEIPAEVLGAEAWLLQAWISDEGRG